MKISTILLFVNFLTVSAISYSQKGSFNLVKNDASIKEVLTLLEKQTNSRFLYRDEDISDKTVSLNARNMPVEEVLKLILTQKGINFRKLDNELYVIMPAGSKQQQAISVSGKITDAATGESMVGVNVVVSGSTQGTVSDLNGNFTITVPNAESVLEFSFIGFLTEKVTVGGRTIVNVSLSQDVTKLDEVVVIGYGTIQKKDLTGAVTSLKDGDFNAGVQTSPVSMIQGKVAGVNIVSNSGEPGVAATVRIRGSNSIRSGQDPLYVVDGIALDISDSQPSGASITGAGSNGKKNPLNFLNPDDIESIDVLKDASATAIYGSRGANGVVMITTKKGNKGKSSVSYSNYFGTSRIPKQLDMLSGEEFLALRAEKGLTGEDYGGNTNWQNEIFRVANSQNHNIAISGGTDKAFYRASASYMDQEGVVKQTGMKKYTGRLNFTNNFFHDRIKIEGGITVSRIKDQRVPIGETGGYEGDVILSALKLNPTVSVFDEDGNYNQEAPISSTVRNPLAMIYLTDDHTQTDRLMASVATTVKLIPGLNYKVNLAYDFSGAERKVVQDAELIYLGNGGTVDINKVDLTNYLIENFLTYDKSLNDHHISLLGGHSFQKFSSYLYGFSENGFQKSEIDYLNDLERGNYKSAAVNSAIVRNELQSFYGRVNYDYKSKYLVSAIIRADGSTRFGENNKVGYFPSASFAWRLSEESFLSDNKWLSDLKIRAGWGIIGNQEIPNKISQVSLGSTSGAILDGSSSNVVSGITLNRTPNPDLKWEETQQLNFGVDFAFLNNRISGVFDFFSKNTKNAILYATAISPAPATNVYVNVKDMIIHNKGIELSLNGVLFDKNDLKIELGGVFSKTVNQVTDIPDAIYTGYPSGPGIDSKASQVIMNDESIGTFYGPKFVGFDASGESKYDEYNDAGTPVDKVIGCAMPDFTYSFNLGVNYKRFDASVFFNGMYGNDVYNNLGNIINQNSLFDSGWNMSKRATGNEESMSNTIRYSSRFIEDGSFLRLQNASLGYTFNTQKLNWVSKIRFYVSGNNLLLFTKYSGYDPEVNADHSSTNGVPSLGIDWTQYPKARTFTAGFNVEF